ncbi:MAG: hypothetical protein JW940_33415 [Polyangiaceae bacterium]|nr:hypothetical protein [Polyangiaceae bacterium]
MQIQVRDVLFERVRGPEGAVRVTVVGQGMQARGAHIEARVGSQRLAYVAASPTGAGFVGFLPRDPSPGDRLYVRYSGGTELATNLTFRRMG